MEIKFYCKSDSGKGLPFKEECVGDVACELRALSQNPMQKDLWVRVGVFLKNFAVVKNVSDFSCYVKDHRQGLFTMQIPETRQGGSFCIYYCRYQGLENSLMFLCAELKTGGRFKKLKKAKALAAAYKEWEERINKCQRN